MKTTTKQLWAVFAAATLLGFTEVKAQWTNANPTVTTDNVQVGTSATSPANLNVFGTSTLTGLTKIGTQSLATNAGYPAFSVTGSVGKSGIYPCPNLSSFLLYDAATGSAYSQVGINSGIQGSIAAYFIETVRYNGTTTTSPFLVDYSGNVTASGAGSFGSLAVTGASTLSGGGTLNGSFNTSGATFNGGTFNGTLGTISGAPSFTSLGINGGVASGYNLTVSGNPLFTGGLLRMYPSSWSIANGIATPAAPVIELGTGGFFQSVCNPPSGTYATYMANNVLWQDNGASGGNWVFPTVNAGLYAMGIINGGLNFYTGNATSGTAPNLSAYQRMTINTNGQVGIGTASPTALLTIGTPISTTGTLYTTYNPLLTVGGYILGQGFSCIAPPNWADYVFDKNYKLTPLKEVEKYVKENHHLPEVPSAEDLQKNGLDLSEMLNMHMKKIEELTLHMIEMEKKIESLEKENVSLKKSIKK